MMSHLLTLEGGDGQITGKTMVRSALAGGAVLSLPAWLVETPVVTDLPQHLMQARLLVDALSNPDGPYKVQWLTPYFLAYLPMVLSWLLLPVTWAGAACVTAFAFVWSATAHALAWRHGRGLPTALLACIPFFGTALQWGFFPFMSGLAAFGLMYEVLLWTLASPRALRWCILAGTTAVLYTTHLLWFGVGMLMAAVVAIEHRAWRHLGHGILALAPSLGLAAWSTLHVHRTFGNGTHWGADLLTRLHPSVWAVFTVGPAIEPWPTVIFLTLIGFVAAGLWHGHGSLDRRAVRLLVTAGVLILFTLFLPARYTNTIQFNSRWAAPALALLIAAVPVPFRKPRHATIFAALLLGTAVTSITHAWRLVDRVELAGLTDAIERLPAEPRVLGLNYQKSRFVFGEPFLQTVAWAQVRRGGTINFSFAEFSVMPVVFKRSHRTWTEGLDWFPEHVQPSDTRHFSFVLAAGPDSAHHQLQSDLPLVALTAPATPWRLYAVKGP